MQEYSPHDLYPCSFTERMQDGRDAAELARRNVCRLPPRVRWRRGPLVTYVSVSDAAAMLGCSVQHVKLLLRDKRIPGAIKKRLGRREWRIPLDRGGGVAVIPGKHGPAMGIKAKALSRPGEVPF